MQKVALSPRYIASLSGVAENLRNSSKAIEDVAKEVNRLGGDDTNLLILFSWLRLVEEKADQTLCSLRDL